MVNDMMMKNFLKTIARNKICCTFAVSEMTNPVFSAWGKLSPTLPKINRVANWQLLFI